MKVLSEIGNLVGRMAGDIEAIINERENMQAEISSLRALLMERDKDAVKAAQDIRAELEAVRIDALYFEQERVKLEAKLQCLNDRLVALVSDKNSPDNISSQKHYGG